MMSTNIIRNNMTFCFIKIYNLNYFQWRNDTWNAPSVLMKSRKKLLSVSIVESFWMKKIVLNHPACFLWAGIFLSLSDKGIGDEEWYISLIAIWFIIAFYVLTINIVNHVNESLSEQ